MLKLIQVDKYFNRHKKNEIHVIDNTSLELGNTGLVAFLGPSGCGKTTLLNAIGGLDKIGRGKIFIDGKKLPNRVSFKKDKMRVLNIGYIFQDYNLLDNMTVFENVALSLKMIGIKNKSQIQERVNYVLEKVDMYRYRNKPAGMLSGGQRQRVGIARAIVKNPSIIIADEPTGNLDSKNTIEIMNIIKSISKNKLVILVTHERELAEFYASRIISLEDGKVIGDKENNHENELDYRIDNKIYLKDFKSCDTLSKKDNEIRIFTDAEEPLRLDIAIKNGNIYIKSLTDRKVELVDENSSLEFIDGHYKKITKKDYENSNFDLSRLDNSKIRFRYTSIYNFFTMLKTGFKKVANYSLMKKMLLIGFFVSAMFIVYSISNIFGSTNIRDKNFITINREYITIKTNENKVDDYLILEQDANVDYILPGTSSISILIKNESIYQYQNITSPINGSLAAAELINGRIYMGKSISDIRDIVIDKMVIDNAMQEPDFKMLNIKNYEDFLGTNIDIANIGTFKLVGISDTQSPSIYMDKSLFVDIIANAKGRNYEGNNQSIIDYELAKDNIELKSGRWPTEDYETIVNIDYKDFMPENKTIDYKVNDHKLKVVGYYYSRTGANVYYVNNNTIKYQNILDNPSMIIYSKNKEATIAYLKQKGYDAVDSYQNNRDEYIKSIKDSVKQHLIIAGILLAISFVEIFLMIRASFMSRIKEVGIYRAIGTKKTDIYKMFLGEIIVITTIASLPGYALMGAILNEISKIKYIENLFLIDARVMVLSIILIYGLNIIMGLLPIRNVIRKTPAEILSRNDVD